MFGSCKGNSILLDEAVSSKTRHCTNTAGGSTFVSSVAVVLVFTCGLVLLGWGAGGEEITFESKKQILGIGIGWRQYIAPRYSSGSIYTLPTFSVLLTK